MRIEAVASALDAATSTAHVHLKTLEEVGYVVRGSRGYRLGYRFLRDGGEVRERSIVYEITRPEVDALVRETGEVANLGVEDSVVGALSVSGPTERLDDRRYCSRK